MKAITVQQPWAECIAAGVKLIENRSRPVSYRGPLAIHAGLRTSQRGYQLGHVRRTLGFGGGRRERVAMEAAVTGLPRGAVVAVAELVDCHPAAGCCQPWGEAEYDGRPLQHLVLEDVHRLAVPRPATGRLGLWEWSPIQRESIEDALENDRCGICLSVDHFREDCPERSPVNDHYDKGAGQ